ncbi:hypothetical protein EV383_3325 [Pseudonocardia sediminis]|uniref:Uncharacterized protein n=1 Tax=Pseudonocardia sediminis TaxID=1397368 RepID=A0A4V2FQY6_PSEST|nr:DUF6886 family protein [Pseudonocardia sediminis]RZT86430.1 hypothetical protein EV383_3325 [Pseudonocardia sediminis]
MRPREGEVLHFSEDPTIEEFVPHIAASARVRDTLVWAVDAPRAPAYWFPRQCPRVLTWAVSGSTVADVERVIGPSGVTRVHAVEYAWLERMRSVRLYAYRLPAAPFRPFPEPEPARRQETAEPSAHVARVRIRPLGRPEPVGDLLALHEQAGIELRVLPELWTFWEAVTAGTLGFSGIRLRNARPPSPR